MPFMVYSDGAWWTGRMSGKRSNGLRSSDMERRLQVRRGARWAAGTDSDRLSGEGAGCKVRRRQGHTSLSFSPQIARLTRTYGRRRAAEQGRGSEAHAIEDRRRDGT